MPTTDTLKTAKVGDKVTLLTFTGMNIGTFEISKAGKTKIAITKKDGTVLEFSREAGLQTNAVNGKYANKVVDLIEDTGKPKTEKKEAKTEKKSEPKSEPKKTKKVIKKSEVKAEISEELAAESDKGKKTEKVEIEDDAEDFDDEDMDDDFEDIDE